MPWQYIVTAGRLSLISITPGTVHVALPMQIIRQFLINPTKQTSATTLESRINIQVRLSIFEFFSMGYILIKGGFDFFFFFFFFSKLLFVWLCREDSNYLIFEGGLHLLKRLRILFLSNFTGETFILGATSILDSRVGG